MPSLNLTRATSTFKICVNQIENGLINGEVVGCRMCSPMPFNDINSLILGMEYIMEAQDFPQSFQQSRSFAGKKLVSPFAALEQEQCMDRDTVASALGALATAEISVVSRMGSSWQGELIMRNSTVPFSSVLELMYLIDEQMGS